MIDGHGLVVIGTMNNQRRGGSNSLAIFRSAVIALMLVRGVVASNPCHAREELSPTSRPNVLILLADDQRADTIAALGNSQIRTPNLDRLAEPGDGVHAQPTAWARCRGRSASPRGPCS